MHDMMRLKHRSAKRVVAHLTMWMVVAVAGMTTLITRLESRVCFWVGLALYGLGNGPTVGHTYDLLNRLTSATEQGMAIVMFGLNFGASVVPFSTTLLWEHTALAQTALPLVVLVSAFAPVVFTALAVCLAARNKGAQRAHLAT